MAYDDLYQAKLFHGLQKVVYSPAATTLLFHYQTDACGLHKKMKHRKKRWFHHVADDFCRLKASLNVLDKLKDVSLCIS